MRTNGRISGVVGKIVLFVSKLRKEVLMAEQVHLLSLVGYNDNPGPDDPRPEDKGGK